MKLQTHLRNTFLAGIFAVIPIAVTVFIIIQVDRWTRGISEALFGRPLPFVEALIAVAAVYLIGLIVTASIGKLLLRLIDKLLSRVPGLKTLYEAWKQVSLTPGGGEGMFAKVVLVPDETGKMRLLAFTNGESVAGDPNVLCVFIPNAPNPIQGRVCFVTRDQARMTPLSSQEAFKVLLSTGNYVPSGLIS